MLRLVSKFEGNNSPDYIKGWWEALHRTKDLSSKERPREEWVALLFVFRIATVMLERKVKSFTKDAQLKEA